MCCSMQPSVMSDTKLYAGEAVLSDRYVHVLGYQNKAASAGPNAMVLPLPAKGELGPDNMVDTRDFKHFLDDISDATKNVLRGGSRSYGVTAQRAAQVFDVGSYTVVLAKSAADVGAAIEQVPKEKRPTIRDEVLESFNVNYPGAWIAVCCWNGAVDAEPLLWWYEPLRQEMLFAPALDAHDGHAPKLDAIVPVDTHLSFGSTLRELREPPPCLPEYADAGETVRYREKLSKIAAALLPKKVVGTRIKKPMQNGDFYLHVGSAGPAVRMVPGQHVTYALPKTIKLDGWE